VSVVNALSDGSSSTCGARAPAPHALRAGQAAGSWRSSARAETGTSVTFKADREIFPDVQLRFDALAARLRELAYLNDGVRIRILDERRGAGGVLLHGRLREFVRHLNEAGALHRNVICFHAVDEQQRLVCDVGMQYNSGYSETVLAFANNIHNIDGGAHLSGFRAPDAAMNYYARKEGS